MITVMLFDGKLPYFYKVMKRLISILLLFVYLPLSYGGALQVNLYNNTVDVEETAAGGKEEKNNTESERSVSETAEHQVQRQLKLIKKTQSQKAAPVFITHEDGSGYTGKASFSPGSRHTILPQVPLYIRHCVYRL